ncbi:MAG: TPM domain-containing protein [Clostridia bacterium]|nr:TPM domain-containing protein [Clostridia bacterium]
MKKLFTSILAVILAALMAAPAFALDMSEEFYVNDDANILSEATHEYICSENYRLYDMCKGAEVVVVTVDFLGGLNAEEYSYEVFNDWALGDKNEDNGVLLLLCPGEEKYWLMSGTGLSSALSAGKMQTICDNYIEKAFDQGDYDEAAMAGFKAIVQLVDQHYGVSSSEAEEYWNGMDASGDTYTTEISMGTFFMIFMFIVLLVVVLGFLSIGRRRVYHNPRPGTFWIGGMGRAPRPPSSNHWPPSGGFFGSGNSRPPRPGGFFGSGSGMGSFGGGSRPSGRPSSFGGGGRRGGGGGSRGGGAGRR